MDDDFIDNGWLGLVFRVACLLAAFFMVIGVGLLLTLSLDEAVRNAR